METVKKNDFIAFRFSGFSQGAVFDSNQEEDLKKLNPQAKAKESVVVVGKGMVVPGLDSAFEGKEIGKSYEVTISPEQGFGERRRDLVKTIPLKVFTEKKISPYPGLVLALDDMVAKIITISGARVVTDFNSPLAGKEVKYNFTITRKVEDEREKAQALFEVSFKIVPEFEIKDTIIVKGPSIFEVYVKGFSPMFKEILGKELSFELKETKKKDSDKEKSDGLEANISA